MDVGREVHERASACPYEATVQKFYLFSLIHWQFRDDLISNHSWTTIILLLFKRTLLSDDACLDVYERATFI